MFFLTSHQTNQQSLRLIGTHGFGIAVFQFRLWPIESQHAISAGGHLRFGELSVRRNPYVFELPATVWEGNEIDVCERAIG